MNKKLLKKIGASVLLITINSGYTSFATEDSGSPVEKTLNPVVVENPVISAESSENEKASQSDIETSSVNNEDTVNSVSDKDESQTNIVNNSQDEMVNASSDSEEKVSSDSAPAPSVKSIEIIQNSENASLVPVSDNNTDVFKLLSSPEFVSGYLHSASAGWKFVEKSFRNQKWESIEKLVKEFGFNYEKLDRNIENYSNCVNSFFNKNNRWDELCIDGVSVFKNDKVSKDIQSNLNILNYSKKFESINKSIGGYKDVQYYLKDNNKELMENVRKGLKIYFDSPQDVNVIDTLSDEQVASWWVISLLSYMNGAFNFYDNMIQSKVPFDQFKDILKFEFDYIDKSTKSIAPLNKAVNFAYDYALEDIRKMEQESESSDVKSEKEEKTIDDKNKAKEFSYRLLSIDFK